MVMHTKRSWGVARKTREELAELLTSMTWCLCSAFQTEGGSVWANDATSEDGAGEYALLRFMDGRWKQVESITASWCSREKLLGFAEQADRGEFDALDYGFGSIETLRLDFDHKPCCHCM
jgi:hypothetical protein